MGFCLSVCLSPFEQAVEPLLPARTGRATPRRTLCHSQGNLPASNPKILFVVEAVSSRWVSSEVWRSTTSPVRSSSNSTPPLHLLGVCSGHQPRAQDIFARPNPGIINGGSVSRL